MNDKTPPYRLAEALRDAMEWNWLDEDARPSPLGDLCDSILAEYDALPKDGEAVPVPRLVATAPEKIWLQVDPDSGELMDSDFGEQFHNDAITWCADSIGGSQVKYVRADLALAQQTREPTIDAKAVSDAAEWARQISKLKVIPRGVCDAALGVAQRLEATLLDLPKDGEAVPQTREPTIEDAGYVARFISDPLDASPETMLAALRAAKFVKVVT